MSRTCRLSFFFFNFHVWGDETEIEEKLGVLYGNDFFEKKKDKISLHSKLLTKVKCNAVNSNGGN